MAKREPKPARRGRVVFVPAPKGHSFRRVFELLEDLGRRYPQQTATTATEPKGQP